MKAKKLYFVIFSIVLANLLLKLYVYYKFENSEFFQYARLVSKTILILVVIYFVSKIELKFKLSKNKILFLITTTILFVLAIYTKFEDLKAIPLLLLSSKHLLFLLSCILTGIFEEILFRVYLFNTIVLNTAVRNKKSLVYSIIWTSLFFALAHLTNLFNPDYHLFSVLAQIVIAFGLGLILQCLFVRFENLYLIISIHAIINYLGSFNNNLLDKSNDIVNAVYTLGEFKETLVISILFIGIVAIPLSFFLIRRELRNYPRT